MRDIQNLPDNGHLYAAHVINDIWRETDGNAIVVTDVGQHQMWEAQYYKHDTPRSLITSGGLGTMGFALPAAIGAKIACPDAEVWVVVGDGGFQMTMCELATSVQENIDIKVAIINNGYLGMVRQWQEFFYEKRYAATPLVSPDFAKLAEAFGIRASSVSRRAEVLPGPWPTPAATRAPAIRRFALSLFPFRSVGVFSPYYRGTYCTEWALLHADVQNIGVTVHELSHTGSTEAR